jgi:hypothetical protein
MNQKQWIGVLVAVVGLVAAGYAVNGMKKIHTMKSDTNFLTRPTGKNPIGKTINSKVHEKVEKYETEARLLLIGGVALILIGCGAVYYLRRR